LELFKTDHVVGIQDMGAAGLTSSSFEMAGKTGAGLKMDLEKVPAREEGMTPYEFMLSESQERMLICAKIGSEDAVIAIFQKWGLDAAVIGEVTDTGRMELYWHGQKCADMPIAPVSEEAPILDRPTAKPAYIDQIKDKTIDSYDTIDNQEAFEKMVSSLEVVDKSWVYQQYDSMVQTNTIKAPGSLDASVIRIKENGKALAMSSDCNPRYCYIDPHKGAALAVMESGRNVAMSGARPLAITDCLNFGNPQNPQVMWQFAHSCEGIKEACTKLNTPVVSGNVSLYNETDGTSVYPTPAIVMVGLNDSQDSVLQSQLTQEGNELLLVGATKGEFGGSLYIKANFGETAGMIGTIDYDAELALWEFVIQANQKALLECAKDVSMGGIAIALAKLCATSNKGVDIVVEFSDSRYIFDESQSRAIVEVTSQNKEAVIAMAKTLGLEIVTLGTIGGDRLKLNDIEMPLTQLQAIYFDTFAQMIEQDL
jgi:phosphoribosylformylglycinamidine synthase